MQRIACYLTLVTISFAGLAGCSSGWTFNNWRNALTFKKPSSQPTLSVSELQQRAMQLERVQEYDSAAEAYSQILKQDHDHQFAQQRLTQIQRLKHGLPNQTPFGSPPRATSPVSGEREVRQSQNSQLPRINPGPPGTARSIAEHRQELSQARAVASQPPQKNAPGQVSVSMPPWANSANGVQSGQDAIAQTSKKRVPLDQFMKPVVEDKTAQIKPQRKSEASGVVKLPAVYDAQTIRQARNASSPEGVAQVSMTTTLPEIVQSARPEAGSEAMSLIEVEKRLSTHPADPSAIETLVQGIRTENRTGRWEIASTLGVLIQQPDSKSLILDSLSRALSDKEPEMRRNTALVIASLDRHAQELLPALEKRLSDREESVRAAAAYAIDEIR